MASGEKKMSPLTDYIVKTQQGLEVARCLRDSEKAPVVDGETEPFVKKVIRPLNDEDRQKLDEIKLKEREAFVKTRAKISEHDLSMKLLKAEYLFDYSRVIFYFKSENKVDFRELLKSLAAMFKTRIELRQIGVRDEAKLLGGLGCCGKEVCCAQFMTNFYPVSTKMAKEQNLSLNPAKLSGICGRLLCCLGHEHKYYASFHGKFPKMNAEVVVGEETARVMDINYITQKLLLSYPDRRKAYFDLEVVHGRKDKVTGRNLWWIQQEGEEEPDLSVLLKNLNPPGTGKKKKKSSSGNKSASDNVAKPENAEKSKPKTAGNSNKKESEKKDKPDSDSDQSN
jgi:cell fate regulator YaaT (PSP1 superfamily)